MKTISHEQFIVSFHLKLEQYVLVLLTFPSFFAAVWILYICSYLYIFLLKKEEVPFSLFINFSFGYLYFNSIRKSNSFLVTKNEKETKEE